PTLWIKPASSNIANVSVSDLQIDGNRPGIVQLNDPDSGIQDQWTSGVEVATNGSFKVDNVSLTNLYIKRTNGDGITVRDITVGGVPTVPTHITVANNFIEDWRGGSAQTSRQGVALVGGANIIVSSNQFFNYDGYGAAVDIEPN